MTKGVYITYAHRPGKGSSPKFVHISARGRWFHSFDYHHFNLLTSDFIITLIKTEVLGVWGGGVPI